MFLSGYGTQCAGNNAHKDTRAHAKCDVGGSRLIRTNNTRRISILACRITPEWSCVISTGFRFPFEIHGFGQSIFGQTGTPLFVFWFWLCTPLAAVLKQFALCCCLCTPPHRWSFFLQPEEYMQHPVRFVSFEAIKLKSKHKTVPNQLHWSERILTFRVLRETQGSLEHVLISIHISRFGKWRKRTAQVAATCAPNIHRVGREIRNQQITFRFGYKFLVVYSASETSFSLWFWTLEAG